MMARMNRLPCWLASADTACRAERLPEKDISCKRPTISELRSDFVVLLLAVDQAALPAGQHLAALGAGNLHVRLVNGDVGFAAAGLKGLAARFACQRQFAKAALDHGRLLGAITWRAQPRWTPSRRCRSNCRCSRRGRPRRHISWSPW